ncbi:4-coumarate--CoA ligase 1-like [Limulus polyphemus]|uniref:4-coumarate--CoA ligase 1-like n=1 Tax=Limulus polyphemus TaxID=6850 RepID=A0ABM1AZN4_LIMPO|nr:4-coumarate--CoA ligase 1-like [Limulus polyphemus]
MEKKNGVSSSVVLEDKILRSPRCAIEIPEISLPELIYSSLKEHEDRPVLDILVFGKTDGCISFAELLEDDGCAYTGPPKINPRETPLVIAFSSGTTGTPKAIVHTHYSVLAIYYQGNQPTVLQYLPDDVLLGIYPFSHIGGFLFVLNILINGVRLVIVPSYDLNLHLEEIQKHKVTIIGGSVVTLYTLLHNPKVREYDITSIREIITGGSPLNREANEQVAMTAFPFLRGVRQFYGLSEALFVSCVEKGKIIPNSVGTLVASTELKVVDVNTGVTLGPGHDGELFIRGPQLMKGYLKNSVITPEAFTPDGWYATGDYGHYDTEGNLYITDRLKEMIKTGFHQVSPSEIESTLCKHPDVEDAAVVGVPDSELGEIPRGFVVLKPGNHVSQETLKQFVSGYLPPYKRLTGGVEIVDKIPRSEFGKIQRKIMKERFIQQRKT